MDLLDPDIAINLWDPLWRIYSRHDVTTPHYISRKANIINSMITEGSYVNGFLNNTILFSDVTIEEGASLEYSVIMSNVKVGKGAKIGYAIVADDAVIEDGAVVGAFFNADEKREHKITVIGQGALIKAGEVVPEGAMVE